MYVFVLNFIYKKKNLYFMVYFVFYIILLYVFFKNWVNIFWLYKFMNGCILDEFLV